MSENLVLPVARLHLKPHHGFVLSRIDGSMTLAELAQVVPEDSVEDALKFTYGLIVFGVVVLDPPLPCSPFSLRDIMPGHYEARARAQREEAFIRETLGRISGRPPAEVLSVPPGADRETLRAAYEALLGRIRRTRLAEGVRDALKREIDLIEAKVTEAFFSLELSTLESEHRTARGSAAMTAISEDDLARRREFSKTEAQAEQEQNTRLAERYFGKAREYFREGDFFNCIQFCRLAIKFNDESAVAYQLMADALGKNPDHRWQRQAEEAYLRATELDPFNAEIFVSLGIFYKEQGLGSRARKMFEKALEILPSHRLASSELKSLRG
jgi:tetratricopeptide (TPR) repeat protein